MNSTDFHAFGRDHLISAWADLFGRAPELHERQIVQAVAVGEGGYGRASYKNQFTGETAVINNWGASQCGHGPPCGPNCFEVTDTHADGSKYNWCYHRFATPEEGARAYLKILKQIVDRKSDFFEALASRSTDVFVAAMKAGGYFELALTKYQDNVWSNVQKIASTLGEPLSVSREGSASGDDPFLPLLSLPPVSGPDSKPRGSSNGEVDMKALDRIIPSIDIDLFVEDEDE